jgi:preprotein translocase subunit YajC
MGRFAVSIVVISVVLGAVPSDVFLIAYCQEATTGATAPTAPQPQPAASQPEPAAPQPAASSPEKVPTASKPNSSGEMQSRPESTADDEGGATSSSTLTKQPAKTGFLEAFLNNPLNLILVLFVAFYLFMLLVPKAGRKEQKLLQERLSNLKKNDRVVLSSGIHGIVANVNADAGTVTVRVDEGTNAKLTVDRAAIRSVEA